MEHDLGTTYSSCFSLGFSVAWLNHLLHYFSLILSQPQEVASFQPWSNIFERCPCVYFPSLKNELFSKETEALCIGTLLDVRGM